jgi:hypothetical protein
MKTILTNIRQPYIVHISVAILDTAAKHYKYSS